jgi:hypothetical protein
MHDSTKLYSMFKVNEIRIEQDAKLNVLAWVEIFGHLSRNLAKK